jgi:hypothetical protein
MSRLSDLNQRLTVQKSAVRDLAVQAEHSQGGETHRLLRQRENVALAAQATQNDIDALLKRVTCLRVAYTRAQENLAILERYLKTTDVADHVRTQGLEGSHTMVQREIDGIRREMVRLVTPERPDPV